MSTEIEENVVTENALENRPYLAKLKKLLTEKPIRKAALFTHNAPDPDAIGSMMAMEWMLSKLYSIESDGFFGGPISHPQNLAMVNLLEPNIRSVDDYVAEDYDIRILVDTVPSNAGVGDKKVVFDLVIDHHKETCPTDFEGVLVNLKAGSCCGTIFHLIEELGLKLGDGNDAESRVATAMLVGISTDTENLMSDDSSEYEFDAWAKLFEFRSPVVLKRIVNYDRPKFWTDRKAAAVGNAVIEEGIAIVPMGLMPAKHRDLIADMAQETVQWEDVHTAIAFALVDGSRIEGSVRSINASISVPKLAKDLGGKFGNGGGKLGKGAYRFDLGGGGLLDEDDDETRNDTWALYQNKEVKRVRKILAK